MVAAQQFNREQSNPVRAVYGAVTTGSIGKFLRLEESVMTVDTSEYYIKEVERIVGILVTMLQAPNSESGRRKR